MNNLDFERSEFKLQFARFASHNLKVEL